MAIEQNYIYNKINKDGTNSNITTLNFDTTYNALLTEAGQMGWNGDDATFNFKTLEGSVIQLGQETVYYGMAGEEIPNGAAVMFGGVLGNRIIFRLARAETSSIDDERIIGVNEDPKILLGISTSYMREKGTYGYVARVGNINQIQTGRVATENTVAEIWDAKDPLYFDIKASEDHNLHGLLTKNKPNGSLIIQMARVILPSQDVPAGRILVIPDVTLLLSSLADVNLGENPTTNHYLKYDTGTWVLDTPDTGSGTSGVWDGNLKFSSTTSSIQFDSLATPPSTFNILHTDLLTNLNIGGASTNITLGGAGTTIKLPSLISAVGDLLVGTTGSALTRLAKGNTGYVLTAAAGGLTWSAPAEGGTSTPGYTAGQAAASNGYIIYAGNAVDSRIAGRWDSYTSTAPSDTTTQLNFNGKLFASQVWGAVFNDYAELFKKDEPLEAGDVVIKNEAGDGYIKAQGAYDIRVIGVLSDSYSHVIGANKDMSIEENLLHYAPIGLAGRVYVKVIGKVKVGDLLVSSYIKGVAMASTQFRPGTIIGKALEVHHSDEVSRIQMLILNS